MTEVKMLSIPNAPRARIFSQAFHQMDLKQKVIAGINACIYKAINHGFTETHYDWDVMTASNAQYVDLLQELREYYKERGYNLERQSDPYWSSREYVIEW